MRQTWTRFDTFRFRSMSNWGMNWILRGLLGLGVLLLLWGFAQWVAAPRDCAGKLEMALEDAWVEAWDAVSYAVTSSGAGTLPSARALGRSDAGFRLARRLESIAREAFGEAVLVEPSSALARKWLNEFLEIYDEARGAGLVDRPESLFVLHEFESEEGVVSFSLNAMGMATTLRIWVQADCVDGELTRVRVLRPGG